MAKKSLIARQKKREKLVDKYKIKRQTLKTKIKQEKFLDEIIRGKLVGFLRFLLFSFGELCWGRSSSCQNKTMMVLVNKRS